MTKLQRAMQAAQQRKAAGFGDQEGIVVADSELQDRAVFSGFDIEYNELVGTSTQIAALYSHQAHSMGLRPLFISAWCDGLLTGLLLASLPPAESESGVKDDTGPEGCGKCIYCQRGEKCPWPEGPPGPMT